MQCTLGEHVCVQRNTKDISNNYTSEGVRVLGLLPPLLQLWPSGGRAPSSPCPMPDLPFPGRHVFAPRSLPGLQRSSAPSPAPQHRLSLCHLPGWLQPQLRHTHLSAWHTRQGPNRF